CLRFYRPCCDACSAPRPVFTVPKVISCVMLLNSFPVCFRALCPNPVGCPVGIPTFWPEVDGFQPKGLGNSSFHARISSALSVLHGGIGDVEFACQICQ